MSGSPRSPKNRIASSRGHICRSYGEILLRELAHLLLDGLEVFGHERPRDDEVVEEALVGRGTDAALRAGEEIRHRGRQQMRRAVAVERAALRDFRA